MVRCTALRIASSPQPGHQRTSWSLSQSLSVVLAMVVISFMSKSPKPVRAELVEAPFFLLDRRKRIAALRQAQDERRKKKLVHANASSMEIGRASCRERVCQYV